MNFPENKDLYCTVFTALKNMGVKVPKIKNFKPALPKPDKGTLQLDTKVFGVSLFKQEWTYESDYPLPKFLAISTAYLVRFSKTVGLFRKSGSIARQRTLRIKVRNRESLEGSDPNDVASLLKQWLRELPQPLIPHCMQDLFVRCQHLDGENRITASLLSCLLLPTEHLHSLKHLLCFLKKLAMHSKENKMDQHNLALIMAPNIFLPKTQSNSKTCNSLVQLHVSVIELLIKNADHIGEIPQSVLHHGSNLERRGNLELELPAGVLDLGPLKLNRKPRIWPVQDLFSGIRKFVGHNVMSASNVNPSTPEMSWTSPNILCSGQFLHQDALATPLRNEDMQVSNTKFRTVNPRTCDKSFGLLQWRDTKGHKSNRTSPNMTRDIVISRSNTFNSNISTDRMNSIKVLTSNESERKSPKVQFESDESNYKSVAMCSAECNLATSSKEFNVSIPTSLNALQDSSFDVLYWLQYNKVKNKQLDVEQPECLSAYCENVSKSENLSVKPEHFDEQKFFPPNFNSINDPNSDQRHVSNRCVDLHQSKSFRFSSERKYESKGKSNLKVPKKTTRQHSLIRGKPNTTKNGLPRQNSNQNGVPTQSLEINGIVKTFNRNENNTNAVEINSSANEFGKFFSEKDISLILNAANLNLSPLSANGSPNRNGKSSANSVQKKSLTPNKDASYTISLNKGESSFPVCPQNVSNHLDSKIPKLNNALGTNQKRMSEMSPEVSFKTPKLRLSSSVRSTGCSKIPVLSKDRLHLSDLETSFNDSCFLSPNSILNSPNSITWMSGNKYLSVTSPQEGNVNKRESIAQILKNKSGHVSEKIQLFDSQSTFNNGTTNNDGRVPLFQRYPFRSLSQKQCPSVQNNRKALFASQSCDTSASKTRVKGRIKTPMKLSRHSHKSSIDLEALSPSNNLPLKEVTNINFVDKLNMTPNNIKVKDDNLSQKTLTTSNQNISITDLSKIKLKRNSFTGCTPSKLMKKVSRSESSPSCPRPGNRLFRLIEQAAFNSPTVPLKMNNVSNNSSSPTRSFTYGKKSASSLSIQKLKSDEMIDEWQCEF